MRSRWVKTETDIAIGLEHEGAALFLPVEVERCDVPSLWSAYEFISFRGSYEAGLATLLGHLGTGRGSALGTAATRDGEQPTTKSEAPSEAASVGSEERRASQAPQPTSTPMPKETSDKVGEAPRAP